MAPIKNTNRGFTGSSISKVANTQSLAGVAATSTGTVTTPGNGFIYHFFTSPGNFYVSNAGYVDVCVIAGGGGGGTSPTSTVYGGGGGAGGMLQTYRNLFPVGTYTISVGTGGAGQASFNAGGSPGDPSFIVGPVGVSSLTATGGGLGNASPGGSGGGGNGIQINGGATISVAQGNPGGFVSNNSIYNGAGGGGASQRGLTAPTSPLSGAPGGNGRAVFNGDSGIPPTYGTPGPTPGRWFAGGGGGGVSSPGSTSGGSGGGGGGNSPAGNGAAGTVNTGGGGGGTGPGRSGGAGGPGIVIIRYKINPN